MTNAKVDRASCALMVVDVQERLAAAMPEEAGAEAVRKTAQLVRGAGHLGMPVLVTEQYPKGLGPTVPPVREALDELATPAARFEKLDFDVSRDEAIAAALEASGARQVVLAGMESHICVYQSARGLRERGLEVWVALDATCSRDLSHREVARGLWSGAGATVSVVEAVLFDALGRAGGDAFKAISRLIK